MRGRFPRPEDYTVFEIRPGEPWKMVKEDSQERGPYLKRLLVGDIVEIGAAEMQGEKPKPGDRCFADKAFVCRRVYTEADFALSVMQLNDYPKGFGRWRRFFVRVALLIAYGPKRYKRPRYYRLRFAGKENAE